MMNILSLFGVFVFGVSPSLSVPVMIEDDVIMHSHREEISLQPQDLVEIAKLEHEYDNFAQCLTESNVVKYGVDTCPHCARQKELFGSSFQYVNYRECTQNPDECQAKDITGYPTWIYHEEDGSERMRALGVQTLSALSEESGCPLFQ